jgi:hypothetical protein
MEREKRLEYKSYSTRKFRVDLHERLRITAAMERKTIEDMLNLVIEKGLGWYEKGGEG